MAPTNFSVPEGTYVITLKFVPTEDPVITCIVCGQNNCELECTVRDRRNARVTIGKHTRCTWRPIEE